ncbi:MAG: RluA family pseudouridine synthase [Gammaproteobacteria bacterium]
MTSAETVAPRIELKRRVAPEDPHILVDFLHRYSGISKLQLKDAAAKGAVLLRRAGTVKRLRRAKAELQDGDLIELHYDREILARQPPPARCIADRGGYSVWSKPAGMLAQGNEYGDHCALLRVAEVAWQPMRKVWLVHRLDREACGLMAIAHTRPVAANLSRQFQDDRVRKRYRVQVRGDVAAAHGRQGRIEQPLDGKPAVTGFCVEGWDATRNASTLAVEIHTGRLHQIRRHLAALGHPVIGDPRYGTGNKDPGGLRLAAVGLAFRCPLTGAPAEFALAPEEVGF